MGPSRYRSRLAGAGIAGSLRGLAALGLLIAPLVATPESRITVLPARGADGKGMAVSAGLRIELNVVRVLGLQANAPVGTSAWSNGGTMVLGCAGAGACVSRAAGGSGPNTLLNPAAGLTIAQP